MITLLIAQVDDPSDREFLTWLFHEFHRLMFHTAQEYVSDQFEKEEIVQDSFVRIIEHIHTIRNLECYALPFYLVIIVRHTATKLSYFLLPYGKIKFCMDFQSAVKVVLIKDINAAPKAEWFAADDINMMNKSINSVVYEKRG